MNHPKKPRGAPKKDNPASDRVYLRCTPDEKKKWEKAAKKSGQTLGAWLKTVADENS